MAASRDRDTLERSLIRASGFHHFRQSFADPTLEDEYLREGQTKVRAHWKRATIPLAIVTAFAVGAHWMLAPVIDPVVRAAELCLFAVLGLVVVLGRHPLLARRPYETTLTTTLTCQVLGLVLLSFTIHPREISVIGYLAIVIGGIAPQRPMYRAISTFLPAAGFSGILVGLGLFEGRFLAYNVGFSFMLAGIVHAMSYSREEADRVSFLLKRRLTQTLERSDRLLTNVLPEKIAAQMKELPSSEGVMVESFADVTVLFADLVGFTSFAAANPPEATVRLLSDVFRRFDAIAEHCGIEKIKTIGDAYMAVAGLPEPTADHTHHIAEAALEMREALKKYCALMGHAFELRIGIHKGPVIAGVIGTKKFLYDLWGDTVNIASRLESHGVPGQIQISEAVAEALKDRYVVTVRGDVDLKGKGLTKTFILERPRLEGALVLPGAA